jgi:hypothetical protein
MLATIIMASGKTSGKKAMMSTEPGDGRRFEPSRKMMNASVATDPTRPATRETIRSSFQRMQLCSYGQTKSGRQSDIPCLKARKRETAPSIAQPPDKRRFQKRGKDSDESRC